MRRFLFLLAFLFSGVCIRAESLLPPIDGMTWEYQSTEFVTGEAPKRSVVTVRGGKQLLDGREMPQLETISGKTVLKTELISVDDSAISCVARAGRDGKLAKVTPPEKIVPAPLRVGTKWEQ